MRAAPRPRRRPRRSRRPSRRAPGATRSRRPRRSRRGAGSRERTTGSAGPERSGPLRTGAPRRPGAAPTHRAASRRGAGPTRRRGRTGTRGPRRRRPRRRATGTTAACPRSAVVPRANSVGSRGVPEAPARSPPNPNATPAATMVPTRPEGVSVNEPRLLRPGPLRRDSGRQARARTNRSPVNTAANCQCTRKAAARHAADSTLPRPPAAALRAPAPAARTRGSTRS